MNPHENSLSPSRQEGETYEQYRERRKRLSQMSDMAGKWGRVIYDPSQHINPRTGKPKAMVKKND